MDFGTAALAGSIVPVLRDPYAKRGLVDADLRELGIT
jgi:hypothetical protein